MQQLKNADGGITVASTDPSLNCSGFNTLSGLVVKGNLNCIATKSNITSMTSDHPTSPLATGTKIGLGVTIPSLFLMAAILYCIWRARKIALVTEFERSDAIEPGQGGHHERTELPGSEKSSSELVRKKYGLVVEEAYELYGDEQFHDQHDETPARELPCLQ